MNLKERINEDYKQALKNKTPDHSTLTLIRAAIKQVEVDTRKELTNEDIVEILRKEAKKRTEAMNQYQSANRTDLFEKEKQELEIIEKYLPQKLSDEDLDILIDQTIEQIGADKAHFGKIMKQITSQTKGRADGKIIQQKVKEKLG